jgi:hypothetical protein
VAARSEAAASGEVAAAWVAVSAVATCATFRMAAACAPEGVSAASAYVAAAEIASVS